MFIHITRTCGLFLSFWPAIDQVDVKEGVTVPWYRHGVGTTEVDMIKIAWYHAQLIAGWEGSHTFACLFIFHTHGTAVQVVWILQDCMPHPWHNTCSSWCTGRKHVSHWFQHQFPWLSFLLCRSFGCWLHGETSPVLICSFSAAAFPLHFLSFPTSLSFEGKRAGVVLKQVLETINLGIHLGWTNCCHINLHMQSFGFPCCTQSSFCKLRDCGITSWPIFRPCLAVAPLIW